MSTHRRQKVRGPNILIHTALLGVGAGIVAGLCIAAMLMLVFE